MNMLVQIKDTMEKILKKFEVDRDGFTPGETMTSLIEFEEMEQRLAAVEYRRKMVRRIPIV